MHFSLYLSDHLHSICCFIHPVAGTSKSKTYSAVAVLLHLSTVKSTSSQFLAKNVNFLTIFNETVNFLTISLKSSTSSQFRQLIHDPFTISLKSSSSSQFRQLPHNSRPMSILAKRQLIHDLV